MRVQAFYAERIALARDAGLRVVGASGFSFAQGANGVVHGTQLLGEVRLALRARSPVRGAAA